MLNMNRIKEERKKLGLTQKQLADKYNQFIAEQQTDAKPVSYAAISRWESQENEPNQVTWDMLAQFFKVSPAYLRGESGERITDEMEQERLINELKFSDNSAMNKQIKENLLLIFAELLDKVDHLQTQIDEINDPHHGEDRYDELLDR